VRLPGETTCPGRCRWEGPFGVRFAQGHAITDGPYPISENPGWKGQKSAKRRPELLRLAHDVSAARSVRASAVSGNSGVGDAVVLRGDLLDRERHGRISNPITRCTWLISSHWRAIDAQPGSRLACRAPSSWRPRPPRGPRPRTPAPQSRHRCWTDHCRRRSAPHYPRSARLLSGLKTNRRARRSEYAAKRKSDSGRSARFWPRYSGTDNSDFKRNARP
jgi:hypothetical protein